MANIKHDKADVLFRRPCWFGVCLPWVPVRAIPSLWRRQVCSIELIASENFASVAVLEALGSVMTNK